MKRKVRDLLKEKGYEVYTISCKGTLKDAVKLFNEKHIGALLVVDTNENIQGIITERDIMMKLARTEGEIKDMSIKLVMTPREKLIIGTLDDSIEYLMKVMTTNRIRHIPIIGGDGKSKVQGLISIGDVVKVLLKDMDHENRMLKDYIEGSYPV